MVTRALAPVWLFVISICAIGIASAQVAISGNPVVAIGVVLLLGAMFTMLIHPAAAMFALIAARFSFDMAWDQRIAGLGILDIVGAGVPVATLFVVVIRRVDFSRYALVRPITGWVAMVWGLAAIRMAAGGDPLTTVESALRFTGGVAMFFLALMVVRNLRDAHRVMFTWLLGAIPIIIVFYAAGNQGAMEYHGVIRRKARFFDVVTPAIVAALSVLTCTYFLARVRLDKKEKPDPRRIAAIVLVTMLAAQMLFHTFSNAMAGTTCFALLLFFVARRRFVLVGLLLLTMAALSQHPLIQKRWWREMEIASGNMDPVAFASGRPDRWRRIITKYEASTTASKIIGVHGAWGNPENQALQLMFDLGLAGGLLTLVFLAWVTWSLLRWWREATDPPLRLFYAFVLSTAVGSVAAWLTMTMLCMVNFQWWMWSMIGCAVAMRGWGDQEQTAPATTAAPAPATS